MPKIDFQKNFFDFFQKCVFQFFDDLCGQSQDFWKMSPSFGNLMTSAICWWFQKYVSIYFLLNKILKNRFKILIFWLFSQFVKNWDFLNIFFLKPGLTKTFCFMTDFQFSLDGAALFMLLFTQKLLTSASSQSDTFGPIWLKFCMKHPWTHRKFFCFGDLGLNRPKN